MMISFKSGGRSPRWLIVGGTEYAIALSALFDFFDGVKPTHTTIFFVVLHKVFVKGNDDAIAVTALVVDVGHPRAGGKDF
jgi:hypothetical protein